MTGTIKKRMTMEEFTKQDIEDFQHDYREGMAIVRKVVREFMALRKWFALQYQLYRIWNRPWVVVLVLSLETILLCIGAWWILGAVTLIGGILSMGNYLFRKNEQ